MEVINHKLTEQNKLNKSEDNTPSDGHSSKEKNKSNDD